MTNTEQLKNELSQESFYKIKTMEKINTIQDYYGYNRTQASNYFDRRKNEFRIDRLKKISLRKLKIIQKDDPNKNIIENLESKVFILLEIVNDLVGEL